MNKNKPVAKDKYHHLVKNALIAQGWEVTHDPLRLPKPARPLEIDLGAEKLIGATNGKEKIAVEIKSFLGKSEIYDFYHALGQFDYYQVALETLEPERKLFLAVPDMIYQGLFQENITQRLLEKNQVNVIVYNIENQIITKWHTPKK